jgi:hypothetical protein
LLKLFWESHDPTMTINRTLPATLARPTKPNSRQSGMARSQRKSRRLKRSTMQRTTISNTSRKIPPGTAALAEPA